MRVCMVAPSVKIPEPLAQSVHQMEFAKNLVKKGIEVHLVCRREKNRPTHESGTFYHRVFSGELPLKRLLFTRSARRVLRSLVRQAKYDLIHDRGYLFGGSGIAVARKAEIPTVLQIDDDWIRTEALASRIARTGFYRQMALKWCTRTLASADFAFTVSESLKRVAVEEWGGDERRIHVIPNGVDLELFNPEAVPLGMRDRLKAHDDKIVCFVGALGPWHGVDQLLDAFASALRSRENLRLVLAGAAREYSISHLKNRTRLLGIADSVHFLGGLEHEQIPRLLAECDAAVAPYPSRDFGFSPLKVFEYMACGLPTIVSDVPSTKEIVEHEVNGILVPAGDADELSEAIVRLFDDVALARKIRRGALNTAERFSWRESTERLLHLYELAASRSTTSQN